MASSKLEAILTNNGLKKTKVRLALLQQFLKENHALSYNDLKAAVPQTVDKSTLYRNLSNFENAGVIHRINDYTGVTKYALGGGATTGTTHAHFVCQKCETVYCMQKTTNITVRVPSGFTTQKIETIIQGVCDKC